MRIVTIGVYGFDEAAFFDRLKRAGVDTVCDIRRRRGVRGSAYAFANSARLQSRLAELGIRYHHVLELAPPMEVRATQFAADKLAKVAKRQRTQLDQSFIAAYEAQVLGAFDVRSFFDLVDGSSVVALLCVERDADACHRSLVARRLERASGVTIEHLLP